MRDSRVGVRAAVWACAAAAGWAAACGGAEEPPSLPFGPGECLTFTIYWGFIPVGRAVITVSEAEGPAGQPALRLRARTRSFPVISTVYPVDDVVESFVHPQKLYSFQHVRRLKEGRHRTHEETFFDQERHRAVTHDRLDNTSEEYEVPAEAKDIMAFMFFARALKLAPGVRQEHQVVTDEKVYDLSFEPSGFKTLRPGGDIREIRTLEMEPTAAFQGMFMRKGRMWLWISDDERRLLVRATAKIPVVGTIRMDLKSVQQLSAAEIEEMHAE